MENPKSKAIVRQWMRRPVLTAGLMLMPLCGMAQNGAVSGVVTDSDGAALPGVTVQVKGTKKSAITDINGHYTIDAPANSELVFSYIGMDPQDIKPGSRKVINVVLKDNASNLNEVVVVGYGVQKRGTLTSAVSAISGDDLLKSPPQTSRRCWAERFLACLPCRSQESRALTRLRCASVVQSMAFPTSSTVSPLTTSTTSTQMTSRACLCSRTVLRLPCTA